MLLKLTCTESNFFFVKTVHNYFAAITFIHSVRDVIIKKFNVFDKNRNKCYFLNSIIEKT